MHDLGKPGLLVAHLIGFAVGEGETHDGDVLYVQWVHIGMLY